jgi:hypothetical protein
LAAPDMSASRALGPETALPGAPSFSINATIVCSERPNRDTPALQLLVERCRPKKRLPQASATSACAGPEAVFCLRPMVLKNSALKIS